MRPLQWLPFLQFALLGMAAEISDVPYGAFPALSAPAASTSIAARLGRAVIENHCDFPVYVWSVGSKVKPVITVLPDARYSETFRQDVHTSGIALKITTKRDGLYTRAPQTVFAYNLDSPDQVWYDLSDVFGHPFRGHPVRLQPSEPEIYWKNGVPPSGSQTRVHDASEDLTLTLC